MAIAAARVGTKPPSVKCRICGRPSLRGTKLCDQCVAAVKRARHVNTIASEFLPQPAQAVSVRPAARPPRVLSQVSPQVSPQLSPRPLAVRWPWMPTKPAGWGVLIAFAAFAVAVAGTAYLAVQESAERGPSDQLAPVTLDPPATRPDVLPTDASARTSAVPASEGPRVERATTGSAATAPAEALPDVVERPQATPPSDKAVPRKAAAENRNKLRLRTNPPHSSEVSDEGKATIAAPEPVPVVATPAPAPEPPAPDRWETMNDALAACSRESLLAGVMCTERVRYQYCEGYWGQVPQCRAATRPGSSR